MFRTKAETKTTTLPVQQKLKAQAKDSFQSYRIQALTLRVYKAKGTVISIKKNKC